MPPTMKSHRESHAPDDMLPLPPDLEALLAIAHETTEARIGLIIPPGCGKIPIGLAYARRRGGACLLVTSDASSAVLWMERWQEEYPDGHAVEALSRNPQAPALMTITDQEALSACPLRDLLATLRTAGISTLILDEPYGMAEATLGVAERICEALPAVRVLSLSGYPPYHLSRETQVAIENICGRPLAALGIASPVRRGILCPHRDFVYLCEPPAPEDEPYRRVLKDRLDLLRRVAALPFMADMVRRLACRGDTYLCRHHEEVLAMAALIRIRDPKGAARLQRLLGRAPAPHALTAEVAEQAIGYMRESRALLSESEKKALHAVLTSPADAEWHGFSNRAHAWKSRIAGKSGGIAEILAAEEATLGPDLRALVLLPSEFSPKDKERLLSLFHSAAGSAGTAAKLCATTEQLFAAGELRILLITRDEAEQNPLCAERCAQSTNVLILADIGKAAHGDPFLLHVRGSMLRTHRACLRRTVHIWHMATVAGEAHPLISSELDELSTVRTQLRCLPFTIPFPAHPPSTRAARQALNAAALTGARDRRATVRARPRANHTGDEPRVSVSLPHTVQAPSLTPKRLAGLIFSIPAMGIGGFLLRHLVALTWQARGMPTVLAIFLGLTLIAAGMTALGAGYCLRNFPFLWRHRTARASAQSMTDALLRALKQTDHIRSEVTAEVTVPKRAAGPSARRRLTVTIEGASFAEADCVARALCELLSPIREPRYILRRASSAKRNGRTQKKAAVVYACPHILGMRDTSAAVFASCMRRPLGRVQLIYTRREPGTLRLAEARTWGYLNRTEEDAVCQIRA